MTDDLVNWEKSKAKTRRRQNDLEVLNHYGVKPLFDPVTYPPEIQPLWAKLVDIPEDPEEALEFWINDGSGENRLTDSGPRGKWNLLLNARILSFELPPDWENRSESDKKQRRTTKPKSNHQQTGNLLGEQVTEGRKKMNLSQRELAKLMEKSQSWIRDVEKGRLKAKLDDQMLLRQLLDIS